MENMEIEHYQETFSQREMVDGDQSFLKKTKSFTAPETVSDNFNCSFDCNICLDYARDPVVTLCGHLYCWPCIFKWLNSETTSSTLEQQKQHQQCPVCKADVSETTLVPLYGRGNFSLEAEPNNKDISEPEIPSRPPAFGVHSMIATTPNQQLYGRPHNSESQFQSDQNQQFYAPNGSTASPIFNVGGTATHPMIWMFGEMVYARVFGNPAEFNLIGYPNSHHHLTTGSHSHPRMRRLEMKAEKSLNRISIFLFCCIILCLLLF